jgi:hypothetical protein
MFQGMSSKEISAFVTIILVAFLSSLDQFLADGLAGHITC